MRRTFLPYLALAAVLLAGCSGKLAPKEPDSTGSASPEATATPPPLPEAATQETTEGAEAFVEHFVAVVNHSSLSGSIDGLKEISSDTCTSCSKLAETIKGVYEAGGEYTGGAWSLGTITSTSVGALILLTADLTAAEGTLTPASNAEVTTTPPDLTSVTFELEFVAGAWRVRQFAGSAL